MPGNAMGSPGFGAAYTLRSSPSDVTVRRSARLNTSRSWTPILAERTTFSSPICRRSPIWNAADVLVSGRRRGECGIAAVVEADAPVAGEEKK